MIGLTPSSGTGSARWMTTMVLGIILFALGVFVALRPLFVRGPALTGSRGLDMTFAAVFMLRGALNVKTALGRRRRAMAQG
jgi:hypothetical protein